MKQVILVAVYLGAIVVANLMVTRFGTNAVLPVAFVCIGLDLTTRDFLHDVWKQNLKLKMLLLIAAGSVISWALNHDAGQIAMASFLAFASAAFIDTVVYAFLGKSRFLVRVNGSNLFSSFADSAIFLSVAFGGFMPILILKQFGVKFFGGFIWSLVLKRFRT